MGSVRLESASFSLIGRFSELELLKARKELESALAAHAGKSLTINLSELESGGSQALSLLLCAMRMAQKHACSLQMQGMSRGLFDMARVGGVEALLPIHTAE
ncbi:MAG: STAS domain-containing protein [Oleiphilaceae bacterium]|nr:STAS domain-containing protein [Oleiphilaceae bacterium]